MHGCAAGLTALAFLCVGAAVLEEDMTMSLALFVLVVSAVPLVSARARGWRSGRRPTGRLQLPSITRTKRLNLGCGRAPVGHPPGPSSVRSNCL